MVVMGASRPRVAPAVTIVFTGARIYDKRRPWRPAPLRFVSPFPLDGDAVRWHAAARGPPARHRLPSLPSGTPRGKDTVRLKKLTLGLALILLAAGVFAAPALAKDPSVSTLKHRLQRAKHKRDRAHERVVAAAANLAGARELLAATGGDQSAPAPATTPDPAATGTAVNSLTVPAGMSPALAAALLADGVVTADEIAGLQARLTAAKRVERRWTATVRELQKRIRQLKRIAEWNRRGQWKPLIAIASQRYHVSAAGLTRMMQLESNGQRHVVQRAVPRPVPVHAPRVGDELERVARPQHLRRLVPDPARGQVHRPRHGPEHLAADLPYVLLRRAGRPGPSGASAAPPRPRRTSRGKDAVRLRTLITIIALTVVAAGIAAAPAMAKEPSIPKLKQQLRHAKQQRERARDRAQAASRDLAGALALQASAGGGSTGPAIAPPPVTMDQTLAAALLADGVVTADEVAAAQRRATKAKRLARRWTAKVRLLEKNLRTLRQIAEWNRRGTWKPLITIACKKYGISAAGLHRMMMLESGGRRTVGGMYKGLFQYYPSTWAGSWNPWRHESIYNGWAQIRATAYALSRGMGPSQWPNTYPMAF